MHRDHLILSRPVKLRWAGWETDTLMLQNHGWQISADQDTFNRSMQLALNHPRFGIQAITERCDFDYYQSMILQHQGNMHIMAVSDQMATKIIVSHGNGDNFNFQPIDTRPTFTDISMLNSHLDDIAHFKTVPYDTQEVLLESASLNDVLEIALSKQSDRQEHIRKEMVKRAKQDEYRRNSELKAELRLVA